jgi:recombination protein U
MLNHHGQAFEDLIDWANHQYYERGKAVIQKIPTPWKVERKYSPMTGRLEIVSAYPEQKSTVDFGGTAQGKSIWFDAKTTKNKTSFPLKNIKSHQIEFLRQVHEHGGIAFLLIFSLAENKTWFLRILDLLVFMEQEKRKSLSFQWLDEKAPLIYSHEGIVLDYLSEALRIKRG